MVDEDGTIEEGQVEAEASGVSSVDEPAAGAEGVESGESASSVAAEVAAEPELSPEELEFTDDEIVTDEDLEELSLIHI